MGLSATAVDVHAHAIPPEVLERLRRDGALAGVQVTGPDGEAWIEHREGYRYPVGAAFTSVEAVLERMDRARIGHRVLSLPPTLFFYALPAAVACAFCRHANDALAAFAGRGRGRLFAMITVPLQAPEAAAGEVRRMAGEGAVRGVEIGAKVERAELDDPALGPFFDACERAELPVFVHPYYLGPKPRLEPYYLTNTLGNPLDTTLAAARLACGGVLERHPGLRVILAHGGGFFPYQRGRLDHAFRVRAEARVVSGRAPSAFGRQLYFDSLLHDAAALRFLVQTAGAEHVLLGSDDPFDMGTEQPVAFVEQAGLGQAEREAVLGGAAARLFGLAGDVAGRGIGA